MLSYWRILAKQERRTSLARRSFLAAVAITAVAAGLLPSEMARPWSHGTTVPNFRGNPNAWVSAINTSGGIAASRTSGTLPCFVHVSASGIAFTADIVDTAGSVRTGQVPDPYDDLEYRWNFGDAGGTEIFRHPVSGASVNANVDQWGPEAAYVYRTAGDKTITLTIRGKKNNTQFTTATVQQVITVSAFSAAATWWFDSNATPGGNASSEGAASNLLSLLNTKCTNPTSQMQIWIKRGSDFTASTTFQPQGAINGLRIGVHGTGPDPIFGINSGGGAGAVFRMSNGSGASSANKQDIVISNLAFWTSGTSTASPVSLAFSDGTTGLGEDVYFDNCSANSQLSVQANVGWVSFAKTGYTPTDTYYTNRNGWWGGHITGHSGDLNIGMGIIGGAGNWFFVFGLSNFSGKRWFETTDFVHHIYPSCHRHLLFRWINFGWSQNANFCFNLNWNPLPNTKTMTAQAWESTSGGLVRCTIANHDIPPGTFYCAVTNTVTSTDGAATAYNAGAPLAPITGTVVNANEFTYPLASDPGGTITTFGRIDFWMAFYSEAGYYLIDGCNPRNARRGVDCSNGYGVANYSKIRNVIFQNCSFSDITINVLYIGNAVEFTFRDNVCYNNGAAIVTPTLEDENAILFSKFYRNIMYHGPTVSGSSPMFSLYNVLYPMLNPQQFTDNIFRDDRATAHFFNIDPTSWFTGGNNSLVDRNTYWAPNDTGAWSAAGVIKTFTEWKALAGGGIIDPNSTDNVNPNWINPAAGVFR